MEVETSEPPESLDYDFSNTVIHCIMTASQVPTVRVNHVWI